MARNVLKRVEVANSGSSLGLSRKPGTRDSGGKQTKKEQLWPNPESF
jgi:hypothetical protein